MVSWAGTPADEGPVVPTVLVLLVPLLQIFPHGSQLWSHSLAFRRGQKASGGGGQHAEQKRGHRGHRSVPLFMLVADDPEYRRNNCKSLNYIQWSTIRGICFWCGSLPVLRDLHGGGNNASCNGD